MAARVFVISDTHFGHDKIYTFTDPSGVRVRPRWDTAAEADRHMVMVWNATVTPQDHIYHLGDVGWDSPTLAELVSQLNGHKRLVAGNHDRMDVRAYREMGFQKVMGCHQFSRGLWLTHIPMHNASLGLSGINVHGHIHERAEFSTQHRNVSVERINYTPQLLEEVVKWHVNS